MALAEPALLMTLSDIAALARVRRPVVSIWRVRAAHTDTPFPASVTREHDQELFDAGQVGSWLAQTGRGNNPDAMADAAAHAILPRLEQADGDTFSAVTALLVLRSLLGGPLGELSPGELSPDDLLDPADEHDPDDRMLYRELEQSSDSLVPLARYIDAAVEAGYGEAAVFENLVTAQLKPSQRNANDTALSAQALELMSRTASALALTQTGDRFFTDLMGSSTDTLIAIASDENVEDLTVITANDDSESARLQRRRLAVHRIPHRTVDVQGDGSFTLPGSAVHIVQLPASNDAGMGSQRMLSALERIVLQLDAAQLALALAPSAVLSDAGLDRDADQVRSDLLRSGRVRAIVRLPMGLRMRKPRQSQTLWLVGAPNARVELAERWTMVANLSTVRLDPVAITDLVSDLVASLGDLATVRAHAFRFARLVLTRTLLATRDSLVAGAHAAARTSTKRGAALVVRAEELLSELGAEPPASPLDGFAIEPATPSVSTTTVNAEQLIAAGHLRYIPGNRLDPADIAVGGTDAGSIRIIGPDEVTGAQPLGHRRINRLRFAGEYPAGRVTEPGDVVFCTSPRPVAIVDTEGTSVVAFPARILRISRSDSNGLLAEVLAADIAALVRTHKRWQTWPFRQTNSRQRGSLASALASLRLHQEQARDRLARLDELAALLAGGVTAGALTLTHTSDIPAPSKGTN